MKNVLRICLTDLERQAVEIVLPGEDKVRTMYMANMLVKTSLLKIFLENFQGVYTPGEFLIAKKIFGEEEVESWFEFFFNTDFKMEFAVSKLFGNYDRNSKRIIYKDIMEVLTKPKKDILPIEKKP